MDIQIAVILCGVFVIIVLYCFSLMMYLVYNLNHVAI
jgi:hypothetical protein